MRSTRLVRTSSVAVVGLLAATLLTGCLGDDKDSKAKSTSTPSASTSAQPTDDATTSSDSSDSSTDTDADSSTEPSRSTRPTASSSGLPDEVEAIKLTKGECVNLASDGSIDKTSCTKAHDAEVGATYTLPDSMSPMSLNFKQDINDKCESLLTPVFKRQADPDALTFQYIYPSSTSWMMDNDRALYCLVGNDDESKLTAPLK